MRNLFRLIAKHYFILLFILLEGLSLLFVFQFNPYQKSVFVNFSRGLNSALYQRIGKINDYLYLREENEKLLLENTRLRNFHSQNTNEIIIRESKGVAYDTTVIQGRWDYYFIPADVINNSVNKQYNYITIDKGTNQGVKEDMGVISYGQVVGVVAGVSKNFATVIPILNRNFRVGSKIERNDYFGILEWDGWDPRFARLREIPLHVDVNKGDKIVTSGFSAIFPPGYGVGEVESIKAAEGNFYDIKVRLNVNFNNLTHVNLIGNIYGEEKGELEKSMGYD